MGSTNPGNTGEGSTALLDAITDPVRRDKLTRICQALNKRTTGLDNTPVNLLTMVRLGVSGPTFDVVSEVLECTI